MKQVLAALIIAVPAVALAQAEPIPEAQLQTSFNECVRGCKAAHSYGFCSEMCGCVTGEIGRHWDRGEFTARLDRLRANPEDEQVRAEMTRLATYCAQRIE